MAIRLVVTRGYGNGTFDGSISDVVRHGYGTAAAQTYEAGFPLATQAGATFYANLLAVNAGLDATATLSMAGVIAVPVTSMDSRTLTIQAHDRIMLIEAGDRDLTIDPSDTTLIIH